MTRAHDDEPPRIIVEKLSDFRDDAKSDRTECRKGRQLSIIKGEYFTDLGNARRLVRAHGENIRFCSTFNAWFIWNGHRWRRDEDGEILRLAKSTIEQIFEESAGIQDETLRANMRRHALASQGFWRLRAMVQVAESELAVVLHPDKLDSNQMLLGVENGVIDLKTCKFREGRREDWITMRCMVAYDPRATCPEWEKFQNLITGGNREILAYKQRMAGVFLTGEIVEILFIPYGYGSNGKTTEFETYQAILGDYAHAVDASLLVTRRDTTGPTPEIVALKNKRVIFINETQEREHLNESRVKYLTGNDTLYGRGLHEKPINFRPTHKTVLRTNHKPIIRGTDLGIWRRIHLIPYPVTIAEGDPCFRERALMPERAGILNWMLTGLKAYQLEGLNPPKIICDATDHYKAEMDLFAQWIEERCHLDHNRDPAPETPSETLLKELTPDFNAWAKDDLRRPWPNATISEKLQMLGLEKRHTRQGNAFVGIKLKLHDDFWR
jgi:putative DNA primase/helicase